MTLDPASFSFIQHYFIERIGAHYQIMIGYANNLLYMFAVIELTFFGLMWALRQQSSFDQLFLKGFKICFIFFLVTHFPYLCNVLIESFAQIGGMVGTTKHLTTIIFNPASLWQYGYDPGISLLKMATQSSGVGLPLLELVLGLSILLTFALFIIQIILQVLGFYFVSFTALLTLPLGVFTPSTDMITQALTNVLKAGIRVMVIIMITGIAVSIWNLYGVVEITQESNLNPILGLLFSSILFLCLSRYIPKIVANSIGRIFMQKTLIRNHQTNVAMHNGGTTASIATTNGNDSAFSLTNAATNIGTAAAATSPLTGAAGTPSVAVTTTSTHRNTSPLTISPRALNNQFTERSADSSMIAQKKHWRMQSEKQIEYIKKALLEALATQTMLKDTTTFSNEEFDDENWRTPH